MTAYIFRRSLIAVFTLAVISFISFVIMELPPRNFKDFIIEYEGTAFNYGGSGGNTIESLTQEQRAELAHRFGIDRPMVIRWASWASKMVRGDFGYYVIGHQRRERVKDIVMARMVPTVALLVFVITLTWTFALPVGIYSAVRQHSIGDYALTFLGFSGLAIPDFLLGLVLMYLFFDLFDMSVGGLFSAEYKNAPWSWAKAIDLLKHMFIPGIVLGTAGTASLIRVMRNNLLDELNKPYVVTARAKGLPLWKTVAKYPVRVAINPFVSSIGLMLPALINGSVIVSFVLSLPTLGPILLIALQQQQPGLAGTIILLLAALTVVGTLLSDILLTIVDPRIKLINSSR